MNELIEQLFANFIVPVSFLHYDGNATAYVTYQQIDSDSVLSADNRIINYVDYYDFDIFTKGNFFPIVSALIEALESAGFMWQPSRSSADLYEKDTKYYHKTLCFAIERSI